MILRSRTCFRITAPLWLVGALLSFYLLPVYGTGPGATVSGRVQLVFSSDPSVRKHQDYSGVVQFSLRAVPDEQEILRFA